MISPFERFLQRCRGLPGPVVDVLWERSADRLSRLQIAAAGPLSHPVDDPVFTVVNPVTPVEVRAGALADCPDSVLFEVGLHAGDLHRLWDPFCDRVLDLDPVDRLLVWAAVLVSPRRLHALVCDPADVLADQLAWNDRAWTGLFSSGACDSQNGVMVWRWLRSVASPVRPLGRPPTPGWRPTVSPVWLPPGRQVRHMIPVAALSNLGFRDDVDRWAFGARAAEDWFGSYAMAVWERSRLGVRLFGAVRPQVRYLAEMAADESRQRLLWSPSEQVLQHGGAVRLRHSVRSRLVRGPRLGPLGRSVADLVGFACPEWLPDLVDGLWDLPPSRLPPVERVTDDGFVSGWSVLTALASDVMVSQLAEMGGDDCDWDLLFTFADGDIPVRDLFDLLPTFS